MAPFVPGGTRLKVVMSRGGDFERIPSSDASVSPRQHASCLLVVHEFEYIEENRDAPKCRKYQHTAPPVPIRGRDGAVVCSVEWYAIGKPCGGEEDDIYGRFKHPTPYPSRGKRRKRVAQNLSTVHQYIDAKFMAREASRPEKQFCTQLLRLYPPICF